MSAAIIWVLAVVGLVQAAFALRAYLLEKREGLPRSSARAALSVAIALGIIGMGIFTQLSGGSSPTKPAPIAERDAPTQTKIDTLKKEIAGLTEALVKKQDELEAIDPSQRVESGSIAPAEWPLMVAVALMLFGFGVLALGDLSTLIPRRKKPAAQPEAAEQVPGQPVAAEKPETADVPTLAGHVHAGRWKKALACAAKISAEGLHKLEVLDFLYLRAFATVMAVAAPEGDVAVGHQDRTDKLAAAAKDLERLLELAPHMAEARWLSGYVKARAADWQGALDTMRAAREELGAAPKMERGGLRPAREDDVPFAENESVCLLMLAEGKLATADNEGATRLFDEVTKIGVLAGQIPVAMVTHRILAVREHIKANKLVEAAEGIARIRQVEGLEEDAQRQAAIACDVYDVAIQYTAGELDKTLAATRTFFGRWLPSQLPDVEDQVADEFLLPAIDKAKLALPAELYRGLFFVEAVVRVDLASRKGQPLSPEDVDAIATLLLRALQFQPRHRESLAALGALYLAYRKDRTEKALAWLDAAITMGVRSPRARALLAEARRAELERKELLAMFRSASARFLSDPAVGVAVRKALIE
ncbi:MAG: hypothetical protein H0T42_12165, partial [Deltaproteobacteria bacterium]|nr:hypothetical protein [Deltaproteobacteria bacterium]